MDAFDRSPVAATRVTPSIVDGIWDNQRIYHGFAAKLTKSDELVEAQGLGVQDGYHVPRPEIGPNKAARADLPGPGCRPDWEMREND